MSNQVYANKQDKLFPNIMTNSWTAVGQAVAAGTPTVPIVAEVLWTSLITPSNFDVGNFSLTLGTSTVTILKEGMYSFSANMHCTSIANDVDIEPQTYARIVRSVPGQDFIIAMTQARCVSQGGGEPAYAKFNVTFVQNLSAGDTVRIFCNSCSETFDIDNTSTLFIQRIY